MARLRTDPEEIKRFVETSRMLVAEYRVDRYDKLVKRLLEKPLPQDPEEALRQLAKLRHDLSKELKSGDDIQVD